MPSINTLMVPRSALYAEALTRILENERSIRLVSPVDFVLPLPPAAGVARQWVILFDVGFRPVPFDTYMGELRTRQMRPRVLLFGEECSETDLLYYLSRGAHGWVSCEQLKQFLALAIKHVADRGIWMPHLTLSLFVERVISEVRTVGRLFQTHPLVSQREQEVWNLVSQGASNKEIAVRLHISERTVKFHVAHLFEKLAVSNRHELTVCHDGHGEGAGRVVSRTA